MEVVYCFQSCKWIYFESSDFLNFNLVLRDELRETLNKEVNGIIDAFQIYLQTLISQAVDSNFIQEIIKENGISKTLCN